MRKVEQSIFGALEEKDVVAYTLTSDMGHQLTVMNYGATVLAYRVPDKEGTFQNIVVHSTRFEDYLNGSLRWGASIGPVAGRLAQGRCLINDRLFMLPQNNGEHHLHGGPTGFDSSFFQILEATDRSLTFYLDRPDATGGYPGRLETWIEYTLQEDGSFTISYKMLSDQDTLANPTNHSYFNLSGDLNRTIDQTYVKVSAQGLAELKEDGIPTGKIVRDTPFLKMVQGGTTFADLFSLEDPQIQQFGGVDHPFILDGNAPVALELCDGHSGRRLTVTTDAPSLVMYTTNSIDEQTEINGEPALIHGGVAIEPQILPDAIHHAGFGNILLKAGQTFVSSTTYKVTIEK